VSVSLRTLRFLGLSPLNVRGLTIVVVVVVVKRCEV
jgi:hypothetical protein